MRKLVFLSILFLTIGLTVKADDVVFKASTPSAVVMGEQFRLTYTINAEGKDLRLTDGLSDFEVLMGPSQSKAYSTSFVNGKRSSETSITFTYILMPKSEGTFQIAPASIKVNNSNYSSNALTIKVLPADTKAESNAASASSGIKSDDLFIQIQISNRKVYEQEGFLVTFKLYSKTESVGITQAKFPEFEGFLAQEIELPTDKQWGLENYNGSNYRVVTLKQTILYPQRSGKISIESGKFDATVRVRIQQKVRSIFDDLFEYQDITKQLTTVPVTIDVKALPSNKPSSFSGAVGHFTMASEISSNNVKSNDAVTVKVKITGKGNVKLIKNPEIVFPTDFDVYDPKVETDIKTTTAGVSGTKTIEYMAIPRYAGDFEIPSIAFSYFDTQSGTYKTLTSEAYKLHVEKGEGGDSNASTVSNFSNKENVKYLGQDIRYLKTKGIRFIAKDEGVFFGSAIYYMCYLIPFLLFILFFIIYRKQVKENANIALVRTKKANKMAIKRLRNAGRFLKEKKKEDFYEEVLRALWGYLSDKLNMPVSTLTKDNVDAELSKYGVEKPLIDNFMDILNTCEFARYAPTEGSDAMDKLYESTVDAIGQMENTIKK